MMKEQNCAVLTAVTFAGVLAGCAWLPSVGPDYEKPEFAENTAKLPDAGAITTNQDNRVELTNDRIAQWWTRFDDKTLEGLVNNSVSNNISFLMAQTRLEQAQWQLLGSFAKFLPTFGAGASWARYWYGPNTRNSGGQYTQYNVRNAALDGNWEIDIFGGNRRLTESSFAMAESKAWALADAWVTLTTQVGAQYINLRTTQERIAVARTNLVLQTETYDILKSRLDSGIGDELAVNQCKYVVEQTRAKIPSLMAQEEALKNAIEILAGTQPGALHPDLVALTDGRDWLLAPQKVAALPLDLIRSRPDVKQAERNLAAQTAQIGVAKAVWFPKFYITGSVGVENKNSTRLFSPDSFFATLGPSVSWPIFQGGAIYANVKATEAKVMELALAYDLAVDKAYADVRNAYSAYTEEYHRYEALKAAVKAAGDAVNISKDLYKNGLKDFNNVLDAQRSLLQLQEEMVISRGQITLDLIDLYRSLGGGLAIDQENEKLVANK